MMRRVRKEQVATPPKKEQVSKPATKTFFGPVEFLTAVKKRKAALDKIK